MKIIFLSVGMVVVGGGGGGGAYSTGGYGMVGVGVRGMLIYLEFLCIILHSLQLALYLS